MDRDDHTQRAEKEPSLVHEHQVQLELLEAERETTLNLLEAATRPNSARDLAQEVLTLMRSWSGCDAVGMRLRQGEDFPYFETRGFSPEFVEAEHSLCALDENGELLRDRDGNAILECMCGNVLCRRFDPSLPYFTERGSFWTNSTTDLLASTNEEDRPSRTRNRCHIEGYESVALVPLRLGDQVLGLLQFNDFARDVFSESKIASLERLAASVAIGLAQRASASAMRESQQRLHEVVRAANVGLWDWDLTTNKVDYSREWKRQIGYEEHEIGDSFEEWESRVHPDDLPEVKRQIERMIKAHKQDYSIEFRFRHRDGSYRWILAQASVIHDDEAVATRVRGSHIDITARKRAEEGLRRVEWMLDPHRPETVSSPKPTAYGDLIQFNTSRVILDAVGEATLHEIVNDYLELLETSAAVYEANGDYALGIFSSGWCRFMDQASRDLCQTDDNREALACGRWHCHESCWHEASLVSMQRGEPVDIECQGGLHIYAVPIRAGGEIVGSMNIGYGDPPRDPERLKELAARYDVDVAELLRHAHDYESRPQFIIDLAKRRLESSARLIGEIVERHRAQEELRESQAILQAAMDNSQAGIAIADAPDGKLRYVNDAGLMIRSGTREDVVNGVGIAEYVKSWRICHMDGTPYRDDEVPLARAVLYGETNSREFLIRRDEHEDRVVWANAAPIHDAEGNVAAGIVVFLDITEQKQYERELASSRATYMTLVESLPDVVMRFDRDGRHLFASGNVEKVTNLPAEAFIGKTHRELGFPEELCTFWENAIRSVFDTEQPEETEFAFEGRNGPAVFDWRLLPERDEKGNVTSALSISRDVTEHRRLEHAYESLFNQMLDGFASHEIILDEAGRPVDYRWLDVNPAFERMTGLSRDIIGKRVKQVLPGTEAHWIDTYGRVVLTGEPAHFEQYAKDLGKYFEVTAYRTGPGRFACIFVDVTERTLAQKALLHERDRAQQYLDVAGVIMLALDARGRVRLINKKGCDILGYAQDELMGIDWIDKCIPTDQQQDVRKVFAKLMGGRTIGLEDAEGRVVTRDGSTRLIHWHNAIVRDEAGQIVGTLSSGEDITDRRALEAQFRQAQKMEAIGRLAAGVAHDFNNQLQVILGYGHMLMEDRQPDDPLMNALRQILDAANRARSTTSHLLSFGRQQVMHLETVEIGKFLHETQKPIGRMLGEDIHLEVIAPPGLWDIFIDPSGLHQAIMNLAINARDAMPDGGKLTIRASNVSLDEAAAAHYPEAEPGDYVLVEIIDTGMGMDAAMLERVFEPFYTTKEPGKGTGLGMPMVLGFVRQSRGFVRLDSEPERGTNVKLIFPRLQSSDLGAASQSTAARTIDQTGQGLVLVVEDDEGVRQIIEHALRLAGYEVLLADGPVAALDMLRKPDRVPDVVVSDMVMPEMRGDELARRLRRQHPSLEFVFVSGYTNVEISGYDVLRKPFQPAELVGRVRAAMKERP